MGIKQQSAIGSTVNRISQLHVPARYLTKKMDKFSLFFSVLLVPSLAHACSPIPAIFLEVAEPCAEYLTEEQQGFIGAEEPNDVLRDYSLCFYKGLKYYRNGGFDLPSVKKFLKDNVADADVAEKLYKFNEKYMIEANKVVGSDVDRAYNFFLQTYRPENRQLVNEAWC